MIKLYLQKKLEKVWLLMRLQRYEKAEKLISSLLDNIPSKVEERHLNALKAVCFYRLGKLSDAIDVLKSAVKRKPQSLELTLCLAACLADQGEYNESAKTYKTVEKSSHISETLTDIKTSLVFAAYEINKFFGNIESAVQDFVQFQELNPSSLSDELDFARVHISAKKYRDATKILQTVIARHPGSTEGHTLLGLSYLSEGRLSNAKDAWKKALEINPNVKNARIFLDVLNIASRNPFPLGKG